MASAAPAVSDKERADFARGSHRTHSDSIRLSGMNVPEDLLYSSDHEWVRKEGDAGRVTVGITDYAQDALGDVVFVQVPGTGATVTAGQTITEVESTKSVSDIFAPVAGTIVEVNDALGETPQLLNEDPYGDGWICIIDTGTTADSEGLMDAAAYRDLIEG